MPGVEIFYPKNTRGLTYIIVSSEDLQLVLTNKWYKCGKYIASTKKQITYQGRTSSLLHRLLLDIPKYKEVDHINGKRLDNRRENLRVCTRSQNNGNWKKREGISKHKGVSFNSQIGLKNPWRAKCKGINLGYFKTEIEAAEEYNKKALEVYGKFANLNEF